IHHGGPDKAICAYAANHYPYWQERLAQPKMKYGGFGENLTLANVAENTVCIGDVWSIGETIIQVSQPRQPCWKLAKRWNIKDLAYQVQQTGRTGWYFRVLNEGYITQGMPLKLMDRPHAEWSVARANQIMHFDKTNFDLAAQLAAIPLLSSGWRTTLTKRIRDRVEPNVLSRLEGLA
ncbi:MAG: MOSC domain-containing protein, partial [Planctomycetaceae bacterium]|nr:MOSC domain-containing protein [Planctomycetaceae bacterium]